jgi:hypothetical protein
MRSLLPGVDEQRGALDCAPILEARNIQSVLRLESDCLPISLSDFGRLMRDMALGVLCGAAMGVFVAVLGELC